MNILITEPSDYSSIALRKYGSVGTVYLLPELSTGERERVFQETHIVVVRLGLELDKALLDKLPALRVIATPTTGLNHIDLKETERRRIKIISLRGHTDFLKTIPSTAEEAFALILNLARHLPWAFDDVKKGNWNRDAWKGHQLMHKTIGLWGCGRIAQIMARYANAFNMSILGVDPYVDRDVMKKYGIQKVTTSELLSRSDVISVHILLTEETGSIITQSHFRKMKKCPTFINTARAEVVEKGALLHALEQKYISAAAVDVLWDEKGDSSHLRDEGLLDYARENTNLIITPHIGGATYEAMHMTEEFIAGLVEGFFRD